MSITRCKHGIFQPCDFCHRENLSVQTKDMQIALLESKLSTLRHELANAQQVAILAQELMRMGEVDV